MRHGGASIFTYARPPGSKSVRWIHVSVSVWSGQADFTEVLERLRQQYASGLKATERRLTEDFEKRLLHERQSNELEMAKLEQRLQCLEEEVRGGGINGMVKKIKEMDPKKYWERVSKLDTARLKRQLESMDLQSRSRLIGAAVDKIRAINYDRLRTQTNELLTKQAPKLRDGSARVRSWTTSTVERNRELLDRLTSFKLKAGPPKMQVPINPRFPIVLCHGMGGDKPLLKYFKGVKEDLESLGIKVVQPTVPRYADVYCRAERLREQILDFYRQETGHDNFLEGDFKLNLVGHSMGGLDSRHFISNMEGWKIAASLTTLSTPHRGSSYASFWGEAPVGDRSKIEKIEWALPFDMAAPFNLTVEFMRDVFNPQTLDHPNVSYFSYGGHRPMAQVNPLLWFSYRIVMQQEGPNDGLVSVESSKWGTYMDTLSLDHAEMINWGVHYDARDLYRKIIRDLAASGF